MSKNANSRSISSTQKGYLAPLFAGMTLNQDSIKLSDYRGSYTLLYFWNSTCGASTFRLEETIVPLVNKINSSQPRLKVLGVALDFPEAVSSYIKQKKLTGLKWLLLLIALLKSYIK
ncbi:peroxiredoxin family protein [Xanthocytophaga agilis]|uniref:Redoxin domain-containing protein n=1 Tax=Xanthocytophaga agilis TaxID=3048010 RepID=A0AAE3UBB8_9BACT|nr:redoxin domain-containing protein [Xanthocytophaga agilis]MDJ1499648.1 redoxin domain-containing protein [Xanthocytophaga agilis]